MTWQYRLFGIPKNIDEVADLLQKNNKKTTVINFKESQGKDGTVYSAYIDLGDTPIIRNVKYMISEWTLHNVNYLDGFNAIADAIYLNDKVMDKAKETVEELKKMGIEARIEESKEYYKSNQDSRVTLEYNGTKYSLQAGDMPGLDKKSKGKIKIVNKPGHNTINLQTNFTIKSVQKNDSVYLNGTDIKSIIERIESRKK